MSSAISPHIGTERISDEVIALEISLRNKLNSLEIRSLLESCNLDDAGLFLISLISRYRVFAVIFNSLVSKLIFFCIWSKPQKYNKNLPQRNATADKSLMSNFLF